MEGFDRRLLEAIAYEYTNPRNLNRKKWFASKTQYKETIIKKIKKQTETEKAESFIESAVSSILNIVIPRSSIPCAFSSNRIYDLPVCSVYLELEKNSDPKISVCTVKMKPKDRLNTCQYFLENMISQGFNAGIKYEAFYMLRHPPV